MSLSQILIKKLSKIATLYLCIGILIILFVTIYVQSKIIQNNDIKKIDALNRVIAKSYAVGDLILIQQLLATNFSAENWENVELLDIDGNIIWNKQVIHSDVGIINSLFIVKYDIPIFYNNGEKAAYIIVLKNLADELSLGTRFLFYLILFFVLFWFTFLFYANSNIQTLLSPLSRLAKDLDMQRKKYGITNVLKEDHNLENGDNEVHRIHKWYFEVIQLWQESTKKAVELSKYEGMALISSQVSHDIRSPIAALGMILNSLVGIPEDQRIVLRNAVNRIKDIANDLHINHRKHINNHNNLLNEINEPRLNTTLISTEIENIISEKRIQFRDFTNISINSNTDKAYGVFVKIDTKEFKRSISNILNNSIEALKKKKNGVIDILLQINEQNMFEIRIADNGSGIPQHILDQLGTRGITYGKENSDSGSGLGIYHAKKTIELCGGTFEVESKINCGTTIIIKLNLENSPSWFVKEINITRQMTIVILDDDNTIHGLWEQRFKPFKEKLSLELTSFASGTAFKEWYKKNNNVSNFLFLIDYELLNQNQSGLDIIEELNIANHSILVTSRFDEINILDRCSKLGLSQIPKLMSSNVPINVYTQDKFIDNNLSQTFYDWILIDDDPLIHMTWQFSAKEHQKSFLGFKSYEEFQGNSSVINKNSTIYIDSNLGNGVKGEVVAKNIFSEGFTNLYLATGYEPDQFFHLNYIKNVIGKEPPIS